MSAERDFDSTVHGALVVASVGGRHPLAERTVQRLMSGLCWNQPFFIQL